MTVKIEILLLKFKPLWLGHVLLYNGVTREMWVSVEYFIVWNKKCNNYPISQNNNYISFTLYLLYYYFTYNPPHDGASLLFAEQTDVYVIITLNTGCRYMTYYGPTEHLTILNTQILNLKCGDGQPLKTIIPLLESIRIEWNEC